MDDKTFNVIIQNIDKTLKEINERFENYMKETSCSIKELNESRIRHDEQINMIKERNANKDKELVSIIAQNAKEHQEIMKEQNLLKKQQWIWTGAIAVIVFVIQYIIQIIIK